MKPRSIHQFSEDVTPGDGISNGLRFTQKLLRLCGVESEIYTTQIHRDTAQGVHLISDFVDHPDQVLLIHHGIGTKHEKWLKSLSCKKILVFHNITPSQYFPAHDPIQKDLELGWEQVAQWRDWLDGVISDSDINQAELIDYGYDAARMAVIPLLVDLEQLMGHDNPELFRPYGDAFRLLFIGRAVPHKNQVGLIRSLYHARRLSGLDIRLTLVGGNHHDYSKKIQRTLVDLGLEDSVSITGKISDEALAQQFAAADLYVSLSRHEGFGMPLLEAISHQIPVLAFNAERSSIVSTVGTAGLVIDSDEPEAFAAAIVTLIQHPELRQTLIRNGEQHLLQFHADKLLADLQEYLAALGIDIHLQLPGPPFKSSTKTLDFLIEGPFDSNYSLAIVNREIARHLSASGYATGLRASEGGGDYLPDDSFLSKEPWLVQLLENAKQSTRVRHTLRLLYPLRAAGMKGRHRGLNCYGWEESALPSQTLTEINTRLDYVTTMSTWVQKALIDNGVSTPVFNVGIGADHLLTTAVDEEALPPLGGGLRLLHISSCFPRKGVDVLLDAYGRAFDASDDVTLIIKTFPNPHHDIEGMLEHWRTRFPSAPAVTLINEDVSAGALRALYQLAHLLVAPSRGEGFGLPLAEAMLHELPVVTTGYGGQLDFCDETTCWLLDYKFTRASTHMDVSNSVWVEPSSAHLQETLQLFHDAWKSGQWEMFVQPQVAAARSRIEKHFSWQQAAARLAAAATAAETLPALRATPKVGCVTTWHTTCGIASYSKHLLLPALGDCWILANETHEPTEPDSKRVRRCWRSGADDNLTQLLETIDTLGLDLLLIQFNFAFFDLQALRWLLRELSARKILFFITLHSTADAWWGDELKTLSDVAPELQQAQRIFVHGIDDLNRLKSMNVVENVCLFPHGVQASPLFCPPQEATALNGKRIIASYGFLLPHKGIYELIQAFHVLRSTHPDIHLLLVTALYPSPISEQELARCRAEISKLSLGNEITLVTQYLSDAESFGWLSFADAIVFPYQETNESSSAAVRTGLAAGKPVYCTPLPIFGDVSEAINFLAGTTVQDIVEGLEPALSAIERGDVSEITHQQQWLQEHDWNKLSVRLKNLLLACHNQPQTILATHTTLPSQSSPVGKIS